MGEKQLVAGLRRILLVWHSPYLEGPACAEANVSTQQRKIILTKDVRSRERVEVELGLGSFLQAKVRIQVCGKAKPIVIERIVFCANVMYVTPRWPWVVEKFP